MNQKTFLVTLALVLALIAIGFSLISSSRSFLGNSYVVSFEICSPGDMFGDPSFCKNKAERDGNENCMVINADGSGGGAGCHSVLRCTVRCNVSNLRPEDTKALCSDGIDNNGDGRIDLRDAGCVSFRPPDPPPPHFEEGVNYSTCHDNSDEDRNGLIDAADPACARFYPAPPPQTIPIILVPSSTASSTGL